VFALRSPEAIGILPMPRLRLLSPLAFADNPNAVLRDEPGPLALALLPQAVLSELPPSFPAGFVPTPPLLHSTARLEVGPSASANASASAAVARGSEPNSRTARRRLIAALRYLMTTNHALKERMASATPVAGSAAH